MTRRRTAGMTGGRELASTGGRELTSAVLAGAVATGLVLLALGRPWAESSVSTQGMPRQDVVATGTDAVAWLRALTLVGLAAVGAVLVTSGRWRRMLGALTAGVGAAVAAGSALSGAAVREALAAEARRTAAGADGGAVAAALSGAGPSAWPWLAVVAGLLLAAVGLAVAVRGGRWPGMSRRYDAPRDPVPAAPAPTEDDRARPLDEQDAWRALDQGRDPSR